MPKYGVFSGPNTGKYGPEKAPYLDTFQAVLEISFSGCDHLTLIMYMPQLLACCNNRSTVPMKICTEIHSSSLFELGQNFALIFYLLEQLFMLIPKSNRTR